MALNDLKPAKGSVRSRKRVGRGPGSGLGKTSGRGEKGQKSRSGFAQKPGFEGGQMPLHRRLPKRGFSNARFKKEYAEINLGRLEVFEAGTIVTPEILVRRAISPWRMAEASSVAGIPERMLMPSFGPTPETEIKRWKSSSSSGVRKPKSCRASSRTCV